MLRVRVLKLVVIASMMSYFNRKPTTFSSSTRLLTICYTTCAPLSLNSASVVPKQKATRSRTNFPSSANKHSAIAVYTKRLSNKIIQALSTSLLLFYAVQNLMTSWNLRPSQMNSSNSLEFLSSSSIVLSYQIAEIVSIAVTGIGVPFES